LIAQADAIIIAAGAGMGVDSGLPDFRGNTGFWNAYVDGPHHLMAADWRSGDQVWIIDLVTPFGGAAEVMKELRETVFAGREVHQLMPDAHGQGKTLTWPTVRAVH